MYVRGLHEAQRAGAEVFDQTDVNKLIVVAWRRPTDVRIEDGEREVSPVEQCLGGEPRSPRHRGLVFLEEVAVQLTTLFSAGRCLIQEAQRKLNRQLKKLVLKARKHR
jgi:hypothetical protein